MRADSWAIRRRNLISEKMVASDTTSQYGDWCVCSKRGGQAFAEYARISSTGYVIDGLVFARGRMGLHEERVVTSQ